MFYRILILCLLLLVNSNAVAQSKFPKEDARALKVKTFSDLHNLTNKLITGAKTDQEKVRSIFYWITQNISYDDLEFKSDSSAQYYTKIRARYGEINYSDSLYNLIILDTVLKRRRAICDGYARLFQTLCSHANIRTEIVHGMAKIIENINLFDINHAWNAVWLNNQWHLLDACWATEEVDSIPGKLLKEIDEFYFLSNPKQFSYSHYPENKKYFLYENPISKQQFIAMPIVYSNFFTSGFESFSPLNGVVSSASGLKMSVALTKPYTIKEPFIQGNGLSLKKTEIRYLFDQKIDEGLKTVIIFYNGKALLEYQLKNN